MASDKKYNPEARVKLWKKGIIAPWYLRHSQLDIYELLLRERFPFVEAGRRFGKTNSILAFVLERLLQNPGWICRWCFPEKNTAMEVLGQEIPKLQADIPEDQKFHFRTMHSVWLGPNHGTDKNPIQSKLYVRGVNEDKGNSARGPASNIIVADEYGFWNDPEYIIRDALFPQLEGQQGRWLIKASTPPRNMGHRYYVEWEEASRKGRRITRTIKDNEALSPEEYAEIVTESGGEDSSTFKRERMCEHVTDPKLVVMPEWNDAENIVEDDYPRPEWPVFYVSGDSGFDDNAAMLFGWYDFINDEEVIEDEIVVAGMTTEMIVCLSKIKELQIWNPNPDLDYLEIAKNAVTKPGRERVDALHDAAGRKPHIRSYDAQKQIIFDLFGSHNYPVRMAKKDDKYSAIHRHRTRVGQRKFKVKRRCQNLCRQMKTGMWKDDKKMDFERTEGMGHLDALAAAVYFGRIIDRSYNPVPLNHGASHFTHLISPGSHGAGNKTEEALKSIFGPKRGN